MILISKFIIIYQSFITIWYILHQKIDISKFEIYDRAENVFSEEKTSQRDEREDGFASVVRHLRKRKDVVAKETIDNFSSLAHLSPVVSFVDGEISRYVSDTLRWLFRRNRTR